MARRRKGTNGPSGRGVQLTLPFGRRAAPPTQVGLRVRVALVKESEPSERVVLRGSGEVYALLREEAASWDRERFLTVILDNKHRLLGIDQVGIGSLTAAIVHPREVFKGIILANAAAFICVHNHPSGDPTPSKEDLEITRRLKEGADLLGIRFLDHVVIGAGRYVSFVDDGYW